MSACTLHPTTTTTNNTSNDFMEQDLLHCTAPTTVSLPPTPSASDDEEEHSKTTMSLADLIPLASAALFKNKQEPQDSPLARALTKVKIGVQSHRLKEKYLTKEWIRLALAMPVNETMINIINVPLLERHKVDSRRTKEIIEWYEHKLKRRSLSLIELEKKVDCLRQQRQELKQKQQ